MINLSGCNNLEALRHHVSSLKMSKTLCDHSASLPVRRAGVAVFAVKLRLHFQNSSLTPICPNPLNAVFWLGTTP